MVSSFNPNITGAIAMRSARFDGQDHIQSTTVDWLGGEWGFGFVVFLLLAHHSGCVNITQPLIPPASGSRQPNIQNHPHSLSRVSNRSLDTPNAAFWHPGAQTVGSQSASAPSHTGASHAHRYRRPDADPAPMGIPHLMRSPFFPPTRLPTTSHSPPPEPPKLLGLHYSYERAAKMCTCHVTVHLQNMATAVVTCHPSPSSYIGRSPTQAANGPFSTSTLTPQPPTPSIHPQHLDGNELTTKMRARYVNSLFHRPDQPPPSSSSPSPSLAHFIAYALHHTRLTSSVTFAALYLLQRLKTRFIAICGSSTLCLFISAFQRSPAVAHIPAGPGATPLQSLPAVCTQPLVYAAHPPLPFPTP